MLQKHQLKRRPKRLIQQQKRESREWKLMKLYKKLGTKWWKRRIMKAISLSYLLD